MDEDPSFWLGGVVIAAGFGALGLLLWALYDLARTSRIRGTAVFIWFLVILALPVIGAAAYLARHGGRKAKREVDTRRRDLGRPRRSLQKAMVFVGVVLVLPLPLLFFLMMKMPHEVAHYAGVVTERGERAVQHSVLIGLLVVCGGWVLGMISVLVRRWRRERAPRGLGRE